MFFFFLHFFFFFLFLVLEVEDAVDRRSGYDVEEGEG